MNRFAWVAAMMTLAACAGSGPAEDDRLKTVVELGGVPVSIAWDPAGAQRTTARLSAEDAGADIDLIEAVQRGTGCAIAEPPRLRLVGYQDGGRGIEIATDCSQARAPGSIDHAASRRLIEEIERGVRTVNTQGLPPLYEGSAYAAFTKAQLERYCAEDWEVRTAPSGRTEYNPCKRRDAFR
jgi:hypothetical protein